MQCVGVTAREGLCLTNPYAGWPVLRRYLKQLAPLVALLLIAIALVSVGVRLAAYVAIAALLGLAFLLFNRRPF